MPGEEPEELEIEAPDLKLGTRMDREEEVGGCWDLGGVENQGRILDREGSGKIRERRELVWWRRREWKDGTRRLGSRVGYIYR